MMSKQTPKSTVCLEDLPGEILDIILDHSFDENRVLPRCMCKAQPLEPDGPEEENKLEPRGFSHPFLGMTKRSRDQTFDYFARKRSFIEVRVYGNSSVTKRLLRTAEQHGRIVYQRWSTKGMIRPTLTISIENPEYRLQIKRTLDEYEAITLLYDAHTFGVVLDQIYDGDFEFAGSIPTKFEMSTQSKGSVRDRLEIRIILQTFNNVFRYEPTGETITCYGPRKMDDGVRAWTQRSESRHRDDWIVSAENFLLGVEQLLSHNYIDAATKFILACIWSVLNGLPEFPSFLEDELQSSEWGHRETTRKTAKAFRLVWQLYRIASLAWVDLCKHFPFYIINHDFRFEHEFPKTEYSDHEFNRARGRSYKEEDLPEYDYMLFGMSPSDEANFHYMRGSMLSAGLGIRARNSTNWSPSASDFKSALQSLSRAIVMDSDKELYKAERQACADLRAQEVGVPNDRNSHSLGIFRIQYTDIDGKAQVYFGPRFGTYYDFLSTMPRAEKLVYSSGLDRFDKIADRLMDLRLQTLRSRRNHTV